MRRILRAVAWALLALAACAEPVAPTVPEARYCGVRLVRVPLLAEDGTRYTEILIVPRPCVADATLRRGSLA